MWGIYFKQIALACYPQCINIIIFDKKDRCTLGIRLLREVTLCINYLLVLPLVPTHQPFPVFLGRRIVSRLIQTERLAQEAFFPHLVEQHQQSLLPIVRSEEHTSELQSRGHLVCRLLLEKKN